MPWSISTTAFPVLFWLGRRTSVPRPGHTHTSHHPVPRKLHELVLFSLKNARCSWRSEFLRWLWISVSVLSPSSSWGRTRLPLSCLTSSSWVLCISVALSPHDANHSARQTSCSSSTDDNITIWQAEATSCQWFGCRSVDLSPWPAPTLRQRFCNFSLEDHIPT